MKAVSLIRAKAPGVVTVVGGPHFGLSHVAEDTMRHTTDIDVVCVGEGEFALRDLCLAVQEKRDFSGIAGLLWKIVASGVNLLRGKDRAIVTNKGNRQLPPDDLDLMGMPSWHLIDHTKFHSILEGGFEGTRSIGLKSTRGCPYACSFCCENAAMGRRNVRKRTPKLFVDEVEHLIKEYGYNAFDFWDDTFTVMPKHAYAVCDEIIRRKLDIRWYARTTILSPHRDPNLFKRMREAGCVALGAGVESGNFEIQRKIHAEGKNVSCKVIKETVGYAASLGIRVKCFFIWGHPGETPKTLKETLNFMDELNNVNPLITATSGIMRIYPGTELETIARANGSIPADFSWTKYVEFPKSRMFCVDKTLPFFEDTMTIEEIKAIISQHSMQYMTPARRPAQSSRRGISARQAGSSVASSSWAASGQSASGSKRARLCATSSGPASEGSSPRRARARTRSSAVASRQSTRTSHAGAPSRCASSRAAPRRLRCDQVASSTTARPERSAGAACSSSAA
jgi:hypothetical protein